MVVSNSLRIVAVTIFSKMAAMVVILVISQSLFSLGYNKDSNWVNIRGFHDKNSFRLWITFFFDFNFQRWATGRHNDFNMIL